MDKIFLICSSFIITSFIALPAYAYDTSQLYIEEMTWMEVRDHIEGGSIIAIVPTGGTEQNGPHMVTGKHNTIVRYTAGEIAKRLGNALVAPVMAYVPEGRIDPPEGHMQFPGTLSVQDGTFALLLQDAAASLKQHGFKLICFLGESGGNQAVQKEVAARLTSLWQSQGVRVISVSDYYDNNGQNRWVESIGLKVRDPGAHAGLAATSELMALDKQGVRDALRAAHTDRDYRTTGGAGDSAQASANYGRQFLELKIQAAVNQISHAALRAK